MVTSHQKEYMEFTTTASNLVSHISRKQTSQKVGKTHQSLKRRCSPNHCPEACFNSSTLTPLFAATCFTTVRCAAERKMTGNAEAYLIALSRGLEEVLDGRRYS